MNHYPHHIGDYIKSTVHLSNEEDLCYRRLIDLYYDTEKPIGLDMDLIAKRIRCELSVVTKILGEFFSKAKDGFKNKRCNLEIRQYYVKVRANRINGKLGGRPRKTQSVSKTQSVNLANPTETQPNLNQNQNQNQNQITPKVALLPDWVPLESWQGFVEMRKAGKAGARAFTPRAQVLILSELERLKEKGELIADVLDQSTSHGWKGVFPVKGNGATDSDWIKDVL